MHLLLLAIGALMTAVGVVMLAFSVPLTDPAGVALFTSGMIAVVGGLILIALSFALRVLNRIAERLDIQPLPMPAMVPIEHETPPPRSVRVTEPAPVEPPRAIEPKTEIRPSEIRPPGPSVPELPASAEAKSAEAEPKSRLGWFGRSKANPALPPPVVRAEEPRVAPPPEPEPAPFAPPPELTALARPHEPVQAPPPLPVARTAPLVQPPFAPPEPAFAARPAPRPAPPAARPAAPQNGTAANTVYRSGVIDGMAYSLFMDGSIEAELPTGRVRFATIDELQKYLVSKR